MTRKLLCLIFIIFMVTSVNSVVIECTWSGETCSLNTGVVITQPNEVITISGKTANYINTVTTNIGFGEMHVVRYIPANIFTIFTNLKTFSMYNCGLTNLAANFSTNCPALEQLTIEYGNVQEVPEGFLQTCSNVTTVNFRHDQITTIDRNAFKGLAKLKQLDMSYNKITCLHADLFQHTPALTTAHLYFNKISAIDRNIFRNSKLITFFNLRYNLLTYLPVFNLSSTATASMAFYATGNPINAINPNFCSTFANHPLNFYDNFNIPNIPCLPKDIVFVRIQKTNCESSASILQNCYANWVPTMSDNVDCGQGSGVCISSNVLSKFADVLNYLPV